MGDFSKNRSNRVQLSRFLKGDEVVLRGISALKYMEWFVADHFSFDVEKECIFVYAKEASLDGNFNVKIVDDFDEIDYSEEWDIPCCTMNQVVNDVLTGSDLIDQDVLVEALANYYEEQGSFDEIRVSKSNKSQFDFLKELALAFYG